MATFKVGQQVAMKKTALVGEVKKVLKSKISVLFEGKKKPQDVPPADLIAVKKGKPAKASAPAKEAPKKGAAKVDTTPRIQIRVQGTLRGQNWQSIKRQFDTVDGANDYLQQFKLKDVKGREAKVEGVEATIYTNYDLELILAKQAPDGELPVIFTEDARAKAVIELPKTETKAAAGGDKETAAGDKKLVPAAKKGKAAAGGGNLVPLKEICRQLNMEPRIARMKLRSLSKGKKLPVAHEAQGRWEWEPDQVETVKELLSAK